MAMKVVVVTEVAEVEVAAKAAVEGAEEVMVAAGLAGVRWVA